MSTGKALWAGISERQIPEAIKRAKAGQTAEEIAACYTCQVDWVRENITDKYGRKPVPEPVEDEAPKPKPKSKAEPRKKTKRAPTAGVRNETG